MNQLLIRIFGFCGDIKLSDSEEKTLYENQINDYNITTKQFLVERKSNIGYISFVYLLGLFYVLYSIFSDTVRIDSKNNNLINISKSGFILVFIAQIFMLLYMYFTWYNFSISSNLSSILGLIFFFFPILILYLPYKTLLSYINDSLLETAILSYIYSIIYTLLIPIIFITHNILIKMISLSNRFEYEFNGLIITFVVYSGIVLIIFGILYQLFNDFKFPLFSIIYVLFLSVKIRTIYSSSNNWKFLRIFSLFLGIALFIIIYKLHLELFPTDKIEYLNANIFISIYQGYIQYLLTSIIISDYLLNNKIREAPNSLKIISFIIDVKRSPILRINNIEFHNFQGEAQFIEVNPVRENEFNI